ncbi:MAG TPA: lipocalin family protein [Candidatus Limnocylindrales bacterium]|nr:lipocalin family protein [Candidatus Limnocylindrales bacterium]
MTEKDVTLEVVPRVDLKRYLGKWFEIAHLPFRFEKGCSDITATYSLRSDGDVSVLNECLKNGKVKRAKGRAKIVDKATGAKLKVTFFRPFYGDYWIINLGSDYDYSVVGTPNRKYLWILNRTPQMDEKLFTQLVDYAKSKGFPVESLVRTSHSLQETST